jgi:transposase-like protein
LKKQTDRQIEEWPHQKDVEKSIWRDRSPDPKDTEGEFEPVIVKKHERTMSNDLESMIISLFAQGTSTRDIGAHMQKVYGVDVSAEMVTRITDKILPIAKEWQYLH